MAPPVPRERTRRDVPYLVPAWIDPVVARATAVIGGPAGRYAVIGGRGLAGVAAAVTLLGAITLALGVWQKGHCLMKGWSSPDHFWRACYSDLPVVHVSSALAQGELPWAGMTPSNQPPLSGLTMWLIAQVSPSIGQGLAAQQWTLVLWALLCMLLLASGVLAVVALQPRRPWQAAHLAASPVIITLALVSTDLLGVTLTLLALWAWRAGRSWTTGVLLGLALLVRPFPLLVLLAILLIAWLGPGTARRRHSLEVAVGATLAALAVVVPMLLVEPQALTGARDWWGQGAGFGALQMVPRLLGHSLAPGMTPLFAVGGWCLAVVFGAFAVRRRPRTPSVGQLSALMMAVVVLTAPSVSVQTGLWMLIFLALSARSWSEHLVWAFVETLHFVATWLHIAFASDPGRGLAGSTYALVVVLRTAAWLWLLWRVYDEVDTVNEGHRALSPGPGPRPATAEQPAAPPA